MNQLDLKGRHAIVTGGAAGIGFAIAQRLIASGARVSLWDRDDKALAEAAAAARRRTHTATLDVTDEEQVAGRGQCEHQGARHASTRWCAAPASPVRTRRCAIPGCRLEAGARHQPDRRVPVQQGAVAAHAGQRLRPHRQHRLDRRQGRQPQRLRLQRLEGRRDRADQVARQGTREDRHPRQLRDAGRGEDRHVRADDARRTSTSCCRRSRWAASARSKRSPRWWRGCAPRTARSPPARCSICRAGRAVY